ncbi:MAG: hypothetical protein H7Y42_19695 [Chitinophagaceae bacterium]|nr:hypothetical protein [Chitinophagaceae bacterium]
MLANKTSLSAIFHSHKHEILLGLCWLVVQAVLFYQHGIQTDYEARKYIEEADRIIDTGRVSTPNFWLYSVQIFLIAAAKTLNTGYLSVVFIHWILNIIATWALYKFASRWANKLTGLVIALLFIINLPMQTFNSFLQTESLFFSFTILFSCYLLSLQRLAVRNFLAVLAFLILISFTRPTGLLWIPCTFLYLFFRFFRNFSVLIKIGITIVATIGFLFFLNAALGSGGELDFMLPFRDERIICGVPTLSQFVEIKTSDNPNSIGGLLYYVTHNAEQFFRLAWLRTKAFFGLARDYYSKGHNLYLHVYFYILYLLALIGIRGWVRMNKHLLIYCLSLIFLTWASVILTCDDWHNRFFLSVVPYIYILSIPAVKQITEKFSKNASK